MCNAEKKNILISACLLGHPCRYDGRSKPCGKVMALAEEYNLIPICPEVLGGLPTPRVPSEIVGDRVLMRDGRDVTENYRRGAERALEIAAENGCTVAILKSRSPSCGKGEVYDGTFSGTLTDGDGIATKMLSDAGILVLTEETFESFLRKKCVM